MIQKLFTRRFFFLVYITISIVSNAVAVMASFPIGSLVFTAAETARFQNFLASSPWNFFWTQFFPFPAVTGLVVLYLWPLLLETRAEDQAEPLSDLAARRLLNAPLIISLLAIAGWVCGTGFSILLQEFGGFKLEPRGLFVAIANSICFGGITFVFTYYAMDYANREHFIGRLLSGRNISQVPGVLKPSVILRFFIFFFSVGLLPLFLAGLFMARFYAVDERSHPLAIPVALAAMVGVGGLLSWLLARAFDRPLLEMKTAVLQIQEGRLDPVLRVTGTDELGLLGEGIGNMAASLREKEFIKETFGRVVDPAIRDHFLRGNLNPGGELRIATVLFCDLRGFTALSERLSPERVVEMLNTHFETMSKCVEAEGGLINKFIGDAIMAIYNVPLERPDHAPRAFASARKMIESLTIMNSSFESRGMPPIDMGIGLHTGQVLAGNIGSSSRLEYTVIGDTVNVAARIESLCKKSGRRLLVSGETAAQLSEELDYLGRWRLRGREEPVRIFAG